MVFSGHDSGHVSGCQWPGGQLPYIGPSALEAVLELAPGEISEPVRSGMGVHLLRLIDATPATQPSFEEIEPQIRSEWVRRAGDRALRDYLDQLRADGDVQILTPKQS